MQFTKNIKDRHRNGEYAWLFSNVHQRINDKVGVSGLGLRCYAPQAMRTTNKAEYKNTFSYLRRAKRTLLEKYILVTLRQFPFEL